jgi:hypothetical protein
MEQRQRDLAPKRGNRCGQRIRGHGNLLGEIDALKLGLHRRLDRGTLLGRQF